MPDRRRRMQVRTIRNRVGVMGVCTRPGINPLAFWNTQRPRFFNAGHQQRRAHIHCAVRVHQFWIGKAHHAIAGGRGFNLLRGDLFLNPSGGILRRNRTETTP